MFGVSGDGVEAFDALHLLRQFKIHQVGTASLLFIVIQVHL